MQRHEQSLSLSLSLSLWIGYGDIAPVNERREEGIECCKEEKK
jgi:hypothetical protein